MEMMKSMLIAAAGMRAQAERIAHFLGVVVFHPVDGMAAPAHHQVRLDLAVEHARVAQHVEHRVGDRVAAAKASVAMAVVGSVGIVVVAIVG